MSKFATPPRDECWRQLMGEERQMCVHEVMNEVAECGWFTAEQKKLYGTELGMALLSEAAGLRPVATPEEIFAEVAEVAGLRRNVRCYYERRFREALRSHRQEVAEFAQALEEAA